MHWIGIVGKGSPYAAPPIPASRPPVDRGVIAQRVQRSYVAKGLRVNAAGLPCCATFALWDTCTELSPARELTAPPLGIPVRLASATVHDERTCSALSCGGRRAGYSNRAHEGSPVTGPQSGPLVHSQATSKSLQVRSTRHTARPCRCGGGTITSGSQRAILHQHQPAWVRQRR
jgi:hypothetical protein